MGESVRYGFTIIILIAVQYVLTADLGPIFNDDVANIQVIAGQTAWLPCNARHKGSHTYEQQEIIWMNPLKIVFYNGNQMVINDDRVQVEKTEHGDWNLRIDHVRFNDSGQYQCVINTSPVKTKNVYLHVTVPPHILHEESSRDMDVEEGDTVDLRCKATGVPTPNITWYKRTQHTMDVQENLHVEGEVLTIPNIQRYQKGMYICHANNDVPPPKSRHMEIRVQYAPVVKVLTKRLGQVIGKTTVLECSVTSYPRAKIMWIKNGYQIKHTFKYRLEVYPGEADEYTLSLEMPDINRNDFGEYVCEAKNRMGVASAVMVLYEYKEYTKPVPTTTPLPYTTTRYGGYIYDEQYYQEEDLDDGFALSVGRTYDSDHYHKENFNNLKNRHGSNKPFYQSTDSSGNKSGLHLYIFIFSTLTYIYNVLQHL